MIQDCGTATNGSLSSLGLTASGPSLCINSGPTTGAYNRLCLGVTQTGGATISVTNVAGATGSFTLSVNGSAQGFLTVTLPTTTNAVACFTNTTGQVGNCSAGQIVSGPASSTLNAIARWSNTAGSVLADSSALVDNSGNITAPSLIGGTGVSSTLTLESTSGSGSSDSIIFKTGSQVTRWTITTTGVLTGAAGRTISFGGSSSGSTILQAAAAASGTLTLPAATDTLVGKATTDTFTNKTYDTAGTGNVFSINSNAVSAVTGTGSTVVLATSPTLVTPTLGVATATTINKVTITAPATGSTLTIADGKTLTANKSITLAGNDGQTFTLNASFIVTTNDGTLSFGAASKTLTVNNTLALSGTDGSTITFGAGGTVVYTSNNLSVFAATTSAQLASVISDETGSGPLVFATSPTLTTPTLGDATATTINKVTITAPASSATLTIANGKTATFNNSITFAGTDATTMTFPNATDTVMGLGATQTVSAAKTFNSNTFKIAGATSGSLTQNCASVCGSNTITWPAGTTDFSATGGTSQVLRQSSAGAAITVGQLAASDLSNGTTGSNAVALADSPTFTTQITAPIVIGGTGTGSSLTLKSTTGAGATDFIRLVVGNNGAVEAARVISSGVFLVNSTVSASLSSGALTPQFQVHGTTGGGAAFSNNRWSNDGGGPSNFFAKSRGTSPGSHTVVQSGDNVALLQAQGSDGTNFIGVAHMLLQVDAAPSSGIVPGRIIYSTANSAGTITEALRIDSKQHLGVSGTAPTVGTCGTSPTVTSGSTDIAGELTTGSTATTACTVTFANAFTNTPVCVATGENTGLGAVSITSISTSALTFAYSSVTSQKIQWICLAKQT